MAMFRKIVARESYVDAVRARLAKGSGTYLLVSDTPENAVFDVMESFYDDVQWRDDGLTPNKGSLEWYEMDQFDEKTGNYIVIGWQFIADGFYNN